MASKPGWLNPSAALANADTQVVRLTNALSGAAIDAGLGQYTFSSWLASYTANPEQPYVNLRFLDATGANQIGPDVAFDRTTANYWVGNADSSDPTPPDISNHMWSKYLTTAAVPVGARQANCRECKTDGPQQTLPVGSFKANPFGLFDTAGNAAEWVEDCWNDSYRGAPVNGSAWQTGQCRLRVLRGGAFDSQAKYLRSQARFRYDSDVRFSANGFRVLRELQ